MAIFHIDSVNPTQANGSVKEVYNQLKKEMGDVVEPVSLHALIPQLLKANWGVLRETLVVEDNVKRKYKEAVASAISSLNDCPYCVDAHTIMLIGLKDKQTAKAIEKQDLSIVQDPTSRALLEWAYNTKYFYSENIQNPPFSREEAPEIIGTAVFFHYLNRMVTVFLGETILPFNVSFLKGIMKKLAAKVFANALKQEKEPSKVYQAVDMSQFNNPFQWSAPTPRVESALSTFYIVTHELGKKHLPEGVFQFIKRMVDEWEDPMNMQSVDMDMILEEVDLEYKEMARILYYVAFIPFRITETQLVNFRKAYELNDRQILGMFSWCAYLAATKIGVELGKSF